MRNCIFFLMIIFVLIGCDHSNDNEKIYSEYQKWKSEVTTDSFKSNFIYDTFNNLHEIEGNLLNKVYGHDFRFNVFKEIPPVNSIGMLTKYSFNLTDGNSYNVYYNFQTNKYYEEGSPLVDFFIDSSKLANITILFSSFPRNKLSASYSFDDSVYSTLSLQKSSLMPYLYQATVAIKNETRMFINTTASNLFGKLNLKETMNYRDTINLSH